MAASHAAPEIRISSASSSKKRNPFPKPVDKDAVVMPPTGRTRRSSPLREHDGTFAKICGATIHENHAGSSTLYNVQKGKKIKRKTSDYLIEANIITKRTKYVCEGCVNKVENIKPKSTDEANAKNSIDQLNCDIESKCEDIGSYLDNKIRRDIAALYNDREKCSIDNLLQYDPEKWLSERPPVLVGLLRKLCGHSSQDFVISKLIETVYGSRNKNIVLPSSFQENLLVHSLTRNKKLVKYNSKVCPSGSVETISNWLSEQASHPVEFPDGLVRVVFDNEQVIGKTHRVRAENKLPMSIITSHIYIVLDHDSTLQSNCLYTPKNWLFNELSDEQKHSFVQNDDQYTNLFRETRNDFIHQRLSNVVREHQGKKSDFIDDVIKQKDDLGNEKMCCECGAENERSSRKCTNCSGQLIVENFDATEYGRKINPYEHFSNVTTRTNNFTVKTGEPDLCNPSSFQNISEILFNLAERSGINSGRQWLFLECDGGIYTIVEKLLFNAFHCTKCKEIFYGKDAFSDHRCSILHGIIPENEFGWLLPLPGLLHVEMNACKSFFELNWDVFMMDVCLKLGFKSPKALECAKKCYDHHKTFKILEILYIGLADELLVPYIRHCIDDGLEPCVSGYWEWSSSVIDPNYRYMQQMIFTVLHGIMLFRTGCRRGNAEAIVAGREKLSLLFYSRNHPRYQRIMAVNDFIESVMPAELKDVVYSSFTLSRTGNDGHYQGGDACLEEVNKEAKSWISPTGVPTEKDWLQVFRNLDNMTQVRKHFLNIATGEDEQTRHSTTPAVDNKELLEVRELFRRRKYLLTPAEEAVHTNVTGKTKLCNALQNFTAEARALRQGYYRAMVFEEETRPCTLLYVTEDEMAEKTSIANQTKGEIQKQIFQEIENMPMNEGKLSEELFNKTVKGKPKDAYVTFLHSLRN